MELIENIHEYQNSRIYYYTNREISTINSDINVIVLLHPAFGDHTLFKEQYSFFKEKYFLIGFDMVSHGKSQISGKSNISLRNMPEIVKEVLDKMKIEKVHILGVSMGSLIAQSVAYQYPEIVKTVTIVGGYSIHRDNKKIQKAQNKEMFKWVFYLIFSMKKFRKYIVKSAVRSEKGIKIFNEAIKVFTRSGFKGMRGLDKLFVKKDENVEYPLLIIYGDHDLEVSKEAGENLQKLEKNSKYIEIENAGHCANIDNSTIFNKIFGDFVEENLN